MYNYNSIVYVVSCIKIHGTRYTKISCIKSETLTRMCCVMSLCLSECHHFCSNLIDYCHFFVHQYSRDWTAHYALHSIEPVLLRVVSPNPELQIRANSKCLNLVSENRLSYDWINKLKFLLAKSHEMPEKESERLRRNLIEACCCKIFCFSTIPSR